MANSSFKDLVVWQKSVALVEEYYRVVNQLPKHELYSLSDQLRRSAISIPSNIAEGSKRNNQKEFRHFCGIARGSAAELETQIIIVQKLYRNIEVDVSLALLEEV